YCKNATAAKTLNVLCDGNSTTFQESACYDLLLVAEVTDPTEHRPQPCSYRSHRAPGLGFRRHRKLQGADGQCYIRDGERGSLADLAKALEPSPTFLRDLLVRLFLLRSHMLLELGVRFLQLLFGVAQLL